MYFWIDTYSFSKQYYGRQFFEWNMKYVFSIDFFSLLVDNIMVDNFWMKYVLFIDTYLLLVDNIMVDNLFNEICTFALTLIHF